MSDEPKGNWAPEPAGPPPRKYGAGRYRELYEWLDSHPGEWAKITNGLGVNAVGWRRRGYEVTTRNNAPNRARCDIYLRKPVTPEEP